MFVVCVHYLYTCFLCLSYFYEYLLCVWTTCIHVCRVFDWLQGLYEWSIAKVHYSKQNNNKTQKQKQTGNNKSTPNVTSIIALKSLQSGCSRHLLSNRCSWIGPQSSKSRFSYQEWETSTISSVNSLDWAFPVDCYFVKNLLLSFLMARYIILTSWWQAQYQLGRLGQRARPQVLETKATVGPTPTVLGQQASASATLATVALWEETVVSSLQRLKIRKRTLLFIWNICMCSYSVSLD